ncbi:retrovirus-related pol polyprotein from transposon TNT 1-94 [Tanacetum coccineum]
MASVTISLMTVLCTMSVKFVEAMIMQLHDIIESSMSGDVYLLNLLSLMNHQLYNLQYLWKHIRAPIWYIDSGCSRSMTGVKSYLQKYVEQPVPKDHLGKFNAKADDGYFLGYSFISKDFRIFNTRRQKIEETCHVTFDEIMEAIRFTNTSVDEIRMNDSSRYPPDEYLHEDYPSRQYQTNSDISYYITPRYHSLTESSMLNMSLRLIAQGYRQEEGINYDETFARVARMETIKIFLAYATYMNLKVFQMDVKSAFFNEKIKEEVYVQQYHGFECSEFLDYVCKLDKVLYELKQAPKACTSRSHYQSVSKQTTRYPCEASHGHKIEN